MRRVSNRADRWGQSIDGLAVVFFPLQLESDKEMLEIELEEKLRRRRDELRGKIEAINAGGPQQSQATDVATRKAELKRLHKRVEDLTAKLDGEEVSPSTLLSDTDDAWWRVEIETETEEVSAQIAALQKEREKKLALQSDDQRSIAKQQKNVERYLHKRQVLMQRKEECQKSIRDLGVLPEEAFRENNDSTEQVSPAAVFKSHVFALKLTLMLLLN